MFSHLYLLAPSGGGGDPPRSHGNWHEPQDTQELLGMWGTNASQFLLLKTVLQWTLLSLEQRSSKKKHLDWESLKAIC